MKKTVLLFVALVASLWQLQAQDARNDVADKSLRRVPCDQVMLFSGLKYNAREQCWDGTKIYDPQRGFTAKMSARFIDEATLRITGTVMGLSGHFTWKKLE